MELISRNDICRSYRSALEQELVNSDDTLVVFINLSIIEDRIDRLLKAFPKSTLHAIAIKTNPLAFVLKHFVHLGVGLEAASVGEIRLAEMAGVAMDRLVFDSPAKTNHELQQLATKNRGIRINVDSLEELARLPKKNSGFRLGIRINPAIQSQTVDSMNVGGEKSKFGAPISDRQTIINSCNQWEDVDCLHVHIGSQYTDLAPTVEAVKSIVSLAEEINSSHTGKIRVIDIGGGFPVNYRNDEAPYDIDEYANALKDGCPQLFDGTFQLITEFGRYVHANAGWAVSHIEYMKKVPDAINLITHAGADMFLRECYNPADWHHDMFLIDSNGIEKQGAEVPVNIAGPLCFGGDFVDKNLLLPKPEDGDRLVFQDVGANTFSLWSRHCSRLFPKVIAYHDIDDGMTIGKERESYSSIVNFWS